ncbi:TIGR00266 family protein [Massilia sp. W12]|uniref:TIGR00266 family protein n=1 Tax=Massilia sp. W12 TaxID=3126507 RepID=UPI0030CA5DC6
MPVFTVNGADDPMLHVALRQGESIYCESDAMVTMESTLDLKGKMKGGLGGALMRTFANGESFFQQTIEAVRGDGDCLLAPTLPGAMAVIDIGPRQYVVSDGAFVAATQNVELNVRTQNVGSALFGGNGGFFVMESSGQGQLVVSGFGTLYQVEVTPGKDMIIDNAHAVCWDNTLHYEISVTTNGGKRGGLSGLFGSMVNSVTSGEGMVLRFSGSGKVWVCSRNRNAFVGWLASRISPSGQ